MPRFTLGPADLAEGAIRSFDLGERIVLVSRFEGDLHAISDWCNHAGCLLSGGEVERRSVTCPCHGASFDLVTGENLNARHLCGDQDTFPVAEIDGQIVVELDDEEP